LELKLLAYIDEMVWFLWDEYDVMLSTAAVQRCLKRMNWSRKVVDIHDLLNLTIFIVFG